MLKRHHPFTRCIVSVWNGENNCYIDELRWRPGAWGQVFHAPDDPVTAAHAIGECVFEVHGEYKPGRYPTRTFFTQTFVDPDGAVMKTSALRIKTKYAFEKMVKEFPFEFEIEPEMKPVKN